MHFPASGHRIGEAMSKEQFVYPFPRHLTDNIVGLTGYTTKNHICRAILESIAFQTKAVLEAMLKDSGHTLKQLNVLTLA